MIIKDDMKRIQQKEATRTKLLKTAAREFARRGYARANVNEISVKAGFGKGTIYNYFTNKFDLFLAVVKQIIDELVAEIESAISDIEDPVEKLKKGIHTDFHFFDRNRDIAAVILREGFAAEPKKQQEFLQAASAAFDLSMKLIVEGIEQKQYREDIDPTVATILVVGMVENLILMQDALESPLGTPDELAEMVITAFIEGIRKSP
jgi:AcrR family transcriptional regulator